MEENNQNHADGVVDLPTQGSGSILAAARKQQNKSIEEIADELNLSITQIKTIELDQTEGLPEPTYVRGYIRSYAKLLGLKPEDVLQNYLNPYWQESTNLEDIPRGIGSAEDSQSSHFLTPTKSLFLILLAAALSYLWFSGFFDGDTSDSQTITVEQLDADQSIQAIESNTQKTDSDQEINSDEVSVENVLEMTFSQTSWVDIRDQADARLAYRSYTTGEQLSVSSDGPMSVFIGNAEGVNVKFNNEDFNIMEFKEGVYAKFIVGED